MNAAIDSARQDWIEGERRFAVLARAPGEADRLHRSLELVLDGLRRRLGSPFTIEELAEAYTRAETWIRAVFEEELVSGWAADLTTVQDAAFGRYSRSAVDYAP